MTLSGRTQKAGHVLGWPKNWPLQASGRHGSAQEPIGNRAAALHWLRRACRGGSGSNTNRLSDLQISGTRRRDRMNHILYFFCPLRAVSETVKTEVPSLTVRGRPRSSKAVTHPLISVQSCQHCRLRQQLLPSHGLQLSPSHACSPPCQQQQQFLAPNVVSAPKLHRWQTSHCSFRPAPPATDSWLGSCRPAPRQKCCRWRSGCGCAFSPSSR